MGKKKVLNFSFLALLLLLIYLHSPEIFKLISGIKNISIKDFLILSFLCISNQILLGIEIKILCKVFDVHLTFTECIGLSAVRSIANYLPLGAGAVSNAIYLKKQKKMLIVHYTSLLSVSLVLMLMTSSFIGFLTSFYMSLSLQSVRIEIILLFFLVFSTSIFIMFVKLPKVKPISFVTRYLNSFQNGYSLLRNDKKTIINLLILKSVLLIVLIIKMKILFASINHQIDFGTVILISMSIVSFTIVTVLPGNIGLTESISGFVANFSGSTFAYGFIGIATDRIIQATWIFLLGIPFLFYFAHKLSDKSDKK